MRHLVQQHFACVVSDCEVSAPSVAEGHAGHALEGGLLGGPVGEHGAAGQVDQLELVLFLYVQKDKRTEIRITVR